MNFSLKNCGYYWGFAAYVSYHVNHPLYTSPSQLQVYSWLAAFTACQLGNFSVHVLLRNLRPPGSKVRKIPLPDGNPLTALFNLVSCPNYTYEVYRDSVSSFPSTLSSDWFLDQFHHDDPVSSCWHLHSGRSLSDDNVGPRETQELQE